MSLRPFSFAWGRLMEILILLLGSIVGVSVMILFNAWLKISPRARLVSLDEAITRLDTDCVGFEAGEGVLAADGEAALVVSRTGKCLGLLVAKGSDFVIRYLTPGTVRDVVCESDDRLRLRLNDFVFEPAHIRFDNAETASRWADRLTALQDPARS